jgi:hypothetical protein
VSPPSLSRRKSREVRHSPCADDRSSSKNFRPLSKAYRTRASKRHARAPSHVRHLLSPADLVGTRQPMGGPVIEILGNGGPMLPNPTRKCICIIHSNHRPPAPIDDSFDDVSNPDLAIALESHDTPFSHGFHHATRSPATERHCGAHGPDTSDQGDRLPHHVEAAAAARRSPYVRLKNDLHSQLPWSIYIA